MVEYFVPTVPFASYLFSRWGQITGTPENCRRLLAAEEAVLVFPEGARGISKPFSKRYQLAEFGTGFMRLALEIRRADRAGRGDRRRGASARDQPQAAREAVRRARVPDRAVPAVRRRAAAAGQVPRLLRRADAVPGDPDDDDEVLDEKVQDRQATGSSR